jgi:hypothetical protein
MDNFVLNCKGTQRRSDKMNYRILLLPFLVFSIFYFILVVPGIYLTAWGPRIINELNIFLTGVEPLILSLDQKTTLAILLIAPPLLLFVSFFAGTVISSKFLNFHNPEFESQNNSAVLAVFYGVLTIFIFARLFFYNMFSLLPAWFSNYDQWIAARYAVFNSLRIYDFMTIYMLLPTATILLSLRLVSVRLYFRALLVCLPCLFAMFFLFQKRPIIIFLLMCVLTIFLYFYEKIKFRYIAGSFVSLFLIYSLMIVVPTLQLTNTKIQTSIIKLESENLSLIEKYDAKQLNTYYRTRIKAIYQLLSPTTTTLLSTINGIIFRVSLPAVFYVKAYPEIYPYSGLDIPFDQKHPSDNVDVWKLMWPNIEGGLAAAPAQFPLFAQVGLLGTLGIFVLFGFFVGVLWFFLVSKSAFQSERFVQQMLLLMLLIYLTMDSIYNSIMVTYGVFWGFILVELVIFFPWMLDRIKIKIIPKRI